MWLVRLLLVVSLSALLWAAFDNPTIHGTSNGNYQCVAPWDTVLNDTIDFPGGEPWVDGDEIAERCRVAGEDRFRWAWPSGAVAVLSALTLVVLRVRGRVSRAG